MKTFSFIFGLYLLLLSLQPCQDLVADEFLSLQNENELTQLSDYNENTESGTDECSPFCICSCRQTPVADQFFSVLAANELTVFAKTPQNSYQNDYSHLHLDSIWQPPKFNFTA